MGDRPKITCPATGKRVYGTRERAKLELARIRANPRGAVVPKRVYWCPECEWWHLTHGDQR